MAEETIEVMEVVTVMMTDQEIVTGVSLVNIQFINYFFLFLLQNEQFCFLRRACLKDSFLFYFLKWLYDHSTLLTHLQKMI